MVADLNNVGNNFGASGLGDTNTDGLVDLEDLNNVRNHFGESVPMNIPIPEPQSWTLALAGVIAFLTSFHSRRPKA